MNIEKMREEFEAAVKLAFHQAGNVADLTKVRGQYVEDVHQSAWWAWQASRDGLVIELPKIYPDCYCPSTATAYREDCQKSIEAVGLKVKP